MTASGPFAMGPSAMSGSSSFRNALHTSAATAASSNPSISKIASELSNTTPPKLHASKYLTNEGEEAYHEAYSEPEDGVEIIDMNLIKDIDWSAPDVLKRSLKSNTKLTNEAKERKLKGSEQFIFNGISLNLMTAKGKDVRVDLTIGLDLSENEEEQESKAPHEYFFRRQDEMIYVCPTRFSSLVCLRFW
jgi:DNA-directed RNA polymerase III subunit RPC4